MIKGFGDYKKGIEDVNRTTSYTGGESSGMAVVNPTVDNLMEKASQNTKTTQEFEEEKKKGNKNVCKITMWKNGYQVEDEQFVDYESSEGKQFMAELDKGLVPKSIQSRKDKSGLTVSLHDKRTQTYVPPPPPPYTAFKGQSYSLGGISQVSPNTKPDLNKKFSVDPTQPVVSINLRFHNGQKQVIQVNLSTTVGQIYNYVQSVTKINKFSLISGFPPVTLHSDITVAQAELQGSQVIQKL